MTTNCKDLSVLIVDDEKKACINLKNFLIEYVDPLINIVGVANSTHEAEEMIYKLAPNAVFLDIEMPHENAFHFLNRISPFNFEIVFVTAFDEYAIKAFKLNAIDYILKPISISELVKAVQKLKEKISYKKIVAEKNTSFTELSYNVANKIKPHKITLKDANGSEVIDFRDIYFIEAQSSYSRIIFFKENGIRELTMSSPLSDYEELLPNDLFFRVHRSYLINCAHVKKILTDGSSQVLIKGNFTLPVSRRRYASLIEFLKSNEYQYE